MNSRAGNSGGGAASVPSRPALTLFVILPDGSCIPATAEQLRLVMAQARSAERQKQRRWRAEKAAEIQSSLEDRVAAARLLHEFAVRDRAHRRWVARFRVAVPKDAPPAKTSKVRKRARPLSAARVADAGTRRAVSSWAIDDRGMRGVAWQQSYIGRKGAIFHDGIARELWEYDARDEAVLRDGDGEPVIVTNMGADLIEVGAAWQVMEDASTRKNAKIQYRVVMLFDADASEQEMVAALTHFCRSVLESLDLPYSAVIHRPAPGSDERNFHAHLAFALRPMRRVEAFEWQVADEVIGELDGKNGVQMLRHLWAHSMSHAAEQARRNIRYTGLGYAARGLDLEAGEHLGAARSAIVARGGHVAASERNLQRAARNASRLVIRNADRQIAAIEAARRLMLSKLERPSFGRTLQQPAGGRETSAPAGPRSVAEARARSAGRLQEPRAQSHGVGETLSMPRATGSVYPGLPASARVAGKPATRLVAPRLSRQIEASVGSVLMQPARAAAIPTLLRRIEPPAAPFDVASHFLAAPARSSPGTKLTRSSPPQVPTDIAALLKKTEELLHTLAIVRRRRAEEEKRHRAQASARSDVSSFREVASRPASDRSVAPPPLPVVDKRVEDADALTPGDITTLRALAERDDYIHERSEGRVGLPGPVLKAAGLSRAWLERASVQRVLVDRRREQQAVLAELERAARERPSAFDRGARQPWSRDLAPGMAERLQRWSSDDHFQLDVVPVELLLDQAARTVSQVSPSAGNASIYDVVASGGARAGTEIPSEAPHVVAAAFDKEGSPSDALLALLDLVARKPDLIDRSKAELRASSIAPPLVAHTIAGWSGDRRVVDLVGRTVELTLAAGAPRWPVAITPLIRERRARRGHSIPPAPGRGDETRGPEL